MPKSSGSRPRRSTARYRQVVSTSDVVSPKGSRGQAGQGKKRKVYIDDEAESDEDQSLAKRAEIKFKEENKDRWKKLQEEGTHNVDQAECSFDPPILTLAF
ncbi:uncharacterized protein STEHIDRAFT_163488 [Stereum hirsutum FP-91666 SS1]|uniref:Uncharacterized protein n=1 Tax=Stereum hirsutum (strain FP-91666) TaxID=721885 RepID=R7RWH6_STEHR|nr:uncharacterized protein STEHIDRAFT_163488 [Stereum hirsutum FP-91666 SS1]EIM79664.1 hypothetical protein STEHIDRAFT_163488 [Stereum hirsutum FP-91666 SS1]